MNGHFLNFIKSNLKSFSVNDKLFFNCALEAEKEELNFVEKVHRGFKSFCWLQNEPLNELPLGKEHIA